MSLRRIHPGIALAALCLAWTSPTPAQAPTFFPVDEVRPGMVAVGHTVFAGDQIEEFQVHILGVLRNVAAPQRDLVLARLSGGPLANTGVIQGMSGSPVYINGRLLGAVAYALGSFPREPLAGITPIGEMIDAAQLTGATSRGGTLQARLTWPTTPDAVFAELARVTTRAAGVSGSLLRYQFEVTGPPSLLDLAPTLRPIGAAMVLNGFDPSVDAPLRRAMGVSAGQSQAPSGTPRTNALLRPGDPVGMALVRGDLEMGATGTVTHVDGSRVYAFGHPFLNLGPTAMAMTQARVLTVIPSLDTSMKIATLGPAIGTMSQDRATAVAGILGAPPPYLDVNVRLRSDRAPDRQLSFQVLHDQTLTPLFAFVSVLNALAAYERQSGALSLEASGEVTFASGERIAIDDAFAGDGAAGALAAAAAAPIGLAATNDFQPALATRLAIDIRAVERQVSTTIERAWLDTTKPKAGATHTLHVLLRDYRGTTETITVPVTLPIQVTGPMTLLVSDAPTLTALEDRELKPGRATSWNQLVARMQAARRNNRVYVRLISTSAGTVVAGDTLPALPASVRSVFDEDKTVATSPVTRSIIGAWEHRMNRAVRGSRELALTVTSR